MIDARGRAGFVLFLAILAVTVVGALIVATHSASRIDHGSSVSALNRQPAFAASEHALWHSVANWSSTNASLVPGSAVTATVLAAADTAKVTTVRLNEAVYWLMAEAEVGHPPHRARRRTGINVSVVEDSTGVRVEPVRRSWVEVH